MASVYCYIAPWKNLVGSIISTDEESAARQMQIWVDEKGQSIRVQPIYFFSDEDLTEPTETVNTMIDGVLRTLHPEEVDF